MPALFPSVDAIDVLRRARHGAPSRPNALFPSVDAIDVLRHRKLHLRAEADTRGKLMSCWYFQVRDEPHNLNKKTRRGAGFILIGGAGRDRTDDLYIANRKKDLFISMTYAPNMLKSLH